MGDAPRLWPDWCNRRNAARGCLILLGVVLLIHGWTAVYRASREGRMAQEGPYGVVRHPQYTGILLAVFGQIVHWPTLITVMLFRSLCSSTCGLRARRRTT
ncbi:methyltransferase family protein [Cupriavidus basilensis]